MAKLKSKKGATKTETATTTAEKKEPTNLQVARKDATSILDTIGFKDTRKYDNALLTKRLGKLKTYMEAWEGTLDGKTQEMVDGIVKAGPGGFDVVGDEPRKAKAGGDGKAPKAKKAKGEKKARKPGEGTNAFGSRIGSNNAKVDAMLSKKPITMKEIKEKMGGTYYQHMNTLVESGQVKKTDKGYVLAK